MFTELPIPEVTGNPDQQTIMVELPDWAHDLGVGSPPGILVPTSCIAEPEKAGWENVDWWRATFLLMTCQAEQVHETMEGPAHSYSHKLPDSMVMLWERAWVNRIFLFLRRWVSHRAGLPEFELLGDKPNGSLHLTHDVDYVSKTLALRLKQSAFTKYNLLRSLLSGNFSRAAGLLPRLIRFGLGAGDYWQFPVIRELESSYGFSSTWNFYGGVGGFERSAPELLLDPSYRVGDEKIARQLKALYR